MKRLLIILFLCSLPVIAGETNTVQYLSPTNYVIMDSSYITNTVIAWNNIIDKAKDTGTITNLVNSLCARGEVCKVKGHFWRDGRPGEGNGAYFADWHPNTNFRTCTLCGACQTQDITWK